MLSQTPLRLHTRSILAVNANYLNSSSLVESHRDVLRGRRRRIGACLKDLSLSLSMADRGPWDPDDDAYDERVSLDDGGEDPPSDTTLSLQRGTSRQADGRTEQTLGAYESIGSGALRQLG